MLSILLHDMAQLPMTTDFTLFKENVFLKLKCFLEFKKDTVNQFCDSPHPNQTK